MLHSHLPLPPIHYLPDLLYHQPHAMALIAGGPDYPSISGNAFFYQTGDGVLVCVDISGLPHSDGPCSGRFFALHIHEGDSCTGDGTDPFANSGDHLNPGNCPHPYHAGDLPPLIECSGKAFSIFLTSRITVDSIVGRTLILHSGSDDFRTQPSGDAGEKIACGRIVR